MSKTPMLLRYLKPENLHLYTPLPKSILDALPDSTVPSIAITESIGQGLRDVIGIIPYGTHDCALVVRDGTGPYKLAHHTQITSGLRERLVTYLDKIGNVLPNGPVRVPKDREMRRLLTETLIEYGRTTHAKFEGELPLLPEGYRTHCAVPIPKARNTDTAVALVLATATMDATLNPTTVFILIEDKTSLKLIRSDAFDIVALSRFIYRLGGVFRNDANTVCETKVLDPHWTAYLIVRDLLEQIPKDTTTPADYHVPFMDGLILGMVREGEASRLLILNPSGTVRSHQIDSVVSDRNAPHVALAFHRWARKVKLPDVLPILNPSRGPFYPDRASLLPYTDGISRITMDLGTRRPYVAKRVPKATSPEQFTLALTSSEKIDVRVDKPLPVANTTERPAPITCAVTLLLEDARLRRDKPLQVLMSYANAVRVASSIGKTSPSLDTARDVRRALTEFMILSTEARDNLPEAQKDLFTEGEVKATNNVAREIIASITPTNAA